LGEVVYGLGTLRLEPEPGAGSGRVWAADAAW